MSSIIVFGAAGTIDSCIVREALEELDLRPHGRTLVKPNLVAAGKMFPHAHTRPEFGEGVLLALQDRDDGRVDEFWKKRPLGRAAGRSLFKASKAAA